jgi:Zn finger protein HypA/HybF involved in hydrogenase expression
MKRRDVRGLAEQIHDLYMEAAVKGEGFDDALSFTFKRIREATGHASAQGFRAHQNRYRLKPACAHCRLCADARWPTNLCPYCGELMD